MADLDGDGVPDVISGSYDPGDIYWMRGLGKGKYAAVAHIVDKAGVPLAHHPKELAAFNALPKDKQNDDAAIHLRVASFGSWPALVDWDGDGDLDMLIGTFSGDIFLRENVGTRTKPEFSPVAVPVEAAGKPIHVNAHADPVCVDWDGDGLWDLVVSSSDGAVVWFKNEGTAKKPVFGAAQPLVAAKSGNKFWTQYLEPGQQPSPGVRAQICVTDYNGDGRPDLILGDYSQIFALRKLDAEERTAFDVILREEADLTAKLNHAKPDSPEAKAAGDRFAALAKAKRTYYADPESKGVTSSFVWLYLRTPPQR